MDPVVIGALIAVFIVVFVASRRGSQPGGDASARLADVPEVLRQLRSSGTEGSFAAFCFSPSAESAVEESVNIQFSIEAGAVGLDWVLESPTNLRDLDRFLELARSMGNEPEPREMNGVRYWRVIGVGLADLCAAAITDLYHLAATDDMFLVIDGFEYQQRSNPEFQPPPSDQPGADR
jgi:hypothetical protein